MVGLVIGLISDLGSQYSAVQIDQLNQSRPLVVVVVWASSIWDSSLPGRCLVGLDVEIIFVVLDGTFDGEHVGVFGVCGGCPPDAVDLRALRTGASVGMTIQWGVTEPEGRLQVSIWAKADLVNVELDY